MDLAQSIQGGILVFFPSYQIMEQFCNLWSSLKMQDKLKIMHKKAFFQEDTNQQIF